MKLSNVMTKLKIDLNTIFYQKKPFLFHVITNSFSIWKKLVILYQIQIITIKQQKLSKISLPPFRWQPFWTPSVVKFYIAGIMRTFYFFHAKNYLPA